MTDGYRTLCEEKGIQVKQVWEAGTEIIWANPDLLKTVFKNLLMNAIRFNRSGGPIDFALLTDGLRAEREQGITIDVAYRYFETPARKFIIADTPGHEQYTRNMATGASTADLAVILVDAARGLQAQTRRHAYIASLLGIPNVVAAINKMDLVEYSEDVFYRLQEEFLAVTSHLGILCSTSRLRAR